MPDVLQATGQSSTRRAGRPQPCPREGVFPDPAPGSPAAAQKRTVSVVSGPLSAAGPAGSLVVRGQRFF